MSEVTDPYHVFTGACSQKTGNLTKNVVTKWFFLVTQIMIGSNTQKNLRCIESMWVSRFLL